MQEVLADGPTALRCVEMCDKRVQLKGWRSFQLILCREGAAGAISRAVCAHLEILPLTQESRSMTEM